MALCLGLTAFLSVQYVITASSNLDQALGFLLSARGNCMGDSSGCTPDQIQSALAREVSSLRHMDVLKGVALLLLAIFTVWCSYEVLSAKRLDAAEEKAEARAAVVANVGTDVYAYTSRTIDNQYGTLKTLRSHRSASANARRASRHAAAAAAYAVPNTLYRQDSQRSASSSCCVSLQDEQLQQQVSRPPSYTSAAPLDADARTTRSSRRSQIVFSKLDNQKPEHETTDDERSMVGGYEFGASKGLAIDMHGSNFVLDNGELLFDNKQNDDGDDQATLCDSDSGCSKHSSSSLRKAHSHAHIKHLAQLPPQHRLQAEADARALSSLRSSAAVAAAHGAEMEATVDVDLRLASSVRAVRWSCALTMLVLVLFAVILVLKACIGVEIELGERPGFELTCVVWQSIACNMHIVVLAVLMSKGAGSLGRIRGKETVTEKA